MILHTIAAEEDVEEIVFLRPVPCQLEATIRIDGTRNTEEVLADVYHCCGKEIAAHLEITPYAALAGEKRPEDLFNGPLTKGRVSGLESRR